MDVTLTAHDVPEDGDEPSRRFHFRVEDGEREPRLAWVTLRTARVLARELASHTGLDAMMRAIDAASPAEYDALLGVCFRDR